MFCVLSLDVFFAHVAPFVDQVARHFLDVTLPPVLDCARNVLHVNKAHLLMTEAIQQHTPLDMLKWLKEQGVAIQSSHLALAYEVNHQIAIEWLSDLVLPNCHVFLGAIKSGNRQNMEKTMHLMTEACNSPCCGNIEPTDSIKTALKHNDLSLLQWLHSQGFKVNFFLTDVEPVSDLSIIKWLVKQGAIINRSYQWSIIQQGNDKFEWILQETKLPTEFIRSIVYFSKDPERIRLLMQYEPEETQVALDELSSHPIQNVEYSIVELMKMEPAKLLEVLDNIDATQPHTYSRSDVIERLVIANRFDAIRYLHEKGAPLLADIILRAIYHGHHELLSWLIDNQYTISSELHQRSIHLCPKVLQVLLDRSIITLDRPFHEIKPLVISLWRCPTNARLIKTWFPTIDLSTIAIHWKDATQQDYEWWLESGGTLSASTMIDAINSGNLDFIQWTHRNGCAIGVAELSRAVFVGVIKNVEWLLGHISLCSIESAVFNGNRELIQMLHDRGCPLLEHLLKPAIQLCPLHCVENERKTIQPAFNYRIPKNCSSSRVNTCL